MSVLVGGMVGGGAVITSGVLFSFHTSLELFASLVTVAAGAWMMVEGRILPCIVAIGLAWAQLPFSLFGGVHTLAMGDLIVRCRPDLDVIGSQSR